MPSQNKTPYLSLNQWEGNEYPKRIDFVDDNLKIDTALNNISIEVESKETPAGSQSKADTAQANANSYTDTQVGNIAGVGRTIETVKQNSDNIIMIKNSTKKGISSFVGNGNEITIAHGLGEAPNAVYITPRENPNGYLGEFWVRSDVTNIYVGNSGSFTGQFIWVAEK